MGKSAIPMSWALFNSQLIPEALDGWTERIPKTSPGEPGIDQLPASKKPRTFNLAEPEGDPVGGAFKPGFLSVHFVPATDLMPLKKNPGSILVPVEGKGSLLIHYHHFSNLSGQIPGIDFNAYLASFRIQSVKHLQPGREAGWSVDGFPFE